MATHDMSILTANVVPDATGKTFFEPISVATALGTGTMKELVITMQAPAAVADTGFYGAFTVPSNYSGTPVLIIRGVLGEAANTLGFGISSIQTAHSETIEVVMDTEDADSNATWTGLAAEEMYEETIALTPAAAYVAGDVIHFYFYREDGADDQTGEFWLTDLLFRYNDA